MINTCSVTELADKKGRQAIRKVIHENPSAFVVVTGCYAQLKPEEVASIDGVDLVLGAEQKLDVVKYLHDLSKKDKVEVITSKTNRIRSFVPSVSADDRTRYFEGTGWVRLFLFFLYHTLCEGKEPQRDYWRSGEAG